MERITDALWKTVHKAISGIIEWYDDRFYKRVERECFLAVMHSPLSQKDWESVLRAFLNHKINFQDAVILMKREEIPDKWKRILEE